MIISRMKKIFCFFEKQKHYKQILSLLHLSRISDLKDQILFLQFCCNLIKEYWGKTTILNTGISKQVFRKPPGAPGRVRVPWVRAPGMVCVIDGQVGQVRSG